MSRIWAYTLLAWHLLLHILQKVTLLYSSGGIERYRANFLPEGLVWLTQEERDSLAACHRCTGCGLCEAAAGEFEMITKRQRLGPRTMAQSLIRDLSESEHAQDAIETMSKSDLEELDVICPADVPLSRIVEILEAMAERSRELSESRPSDHRQR